MRPTLFRLEICRTRVLPGLERTRANFEGLETGLEIQLKFRVRLESSLEYGHECTYTYVLFLTHKIIPKKKIVL